MSLKNYIFTTINTKATSHSLRHGPIDDRPPAAQRSFRRSATGLPDEVNVLDTHMDWIKQAWKFISIEPVMICWLLPSCLLYIAIENLALEKVFYISDDQFNFLNIIIFSQSRIYSHVAWISTTRIWFATTWSTSPSITSIVWRCEAGRRTTRCCHWISGIRRKSLSCRWSRTLSTIRQFPASSWRSWCAMRRWTVRFWTRIWTFIRRRLVWEMRFFFFFLFLTNLICSRYCIWNFNDSVCRRLERSDGPKKTMHAAAADRWTGCVNWWV